MGRAILLLGLRHHPAAQCRMCTWEDRGPGLVALVKAHVKAQPTHVVDTEQINTATYGWRD